MKSALVLILILFSMQANAQHEEFADSISTLILKSSSDSIRASLYYDAAQYAIMNLGDLVLNRMYNDSTMHYAVKSGHTRLEAKCHFGYGLLERVEGNYEKALDHLQKNIEYFKEDSLMKPYAMFQVGVIYRQTGRLEKGLSTYLEILQIFEHRKDSKATASTLNSIANLYADMENYQEAIINFEKARSIFISQDNKREISNTEKSMALILLKNGEREKALLYAESALSIAEQINYTQLKGSAYHLLGNIHFETDQKKGLKFYLKAREVLEPTGFLKETLDLKKDLGYAYFQLKEYSLAKNLLKETLHDASDRNMLSEVQMASKALSEIYAEEAIYKTAFDYRLQYEMASDSLFELENVKNINQLQKKFETERKDKELIRQELELQKRQSQLNRAYTGGIALLAFGGFLFYRNRKNQKLATTKIENLEKQQKLMALDYMVQGQEEERKRIAQDLHDGLGGLLTTARLQIQNVQNELNKLGELQLLNQAESMINNACTEVRRISHDMMPTALIDLGLQDALEDLCANIMSEHPIHIRVMNDASEDIANENIKVQLYRIFQELLNNTIKHAEANEITINISQSENHLNIQYADDGKGFDSTLKHSGDEGIGMKNINSRIRYLNGNMKMQTKDGFRCRINVPLNNEDN